MANWRKQQGFNHHQQLGNWRSSSFHGKPPLDNRHQPVPLWEKKFCTSIGSVPWGKLLETKRCMYLFSNVVEWDDSAGKEAFDNAKNRFWAEYNGFPCNIPLPDPNLYIDDVDWNASVDPELYLDLEKVVEFRRKMEEKGDETVIIGIDRSLFLKHPIPGWEVTPTGWGDEEEKEVTKPSEEPNSAVQGWESNQPENKETNSWENHLAPVEHAKEYEWQNGRNNSQGWNQGWNQWEQHGVDLHNKYQGRNGGNENWGTGDGYNRNRENMSWSRVPAYHHGNNEYPMNRGRRGNRGGGRGGRRGNFSYVEKVATPSGAW